MTTATHAIQSKRSVPELDEFISAREAEDPKVRKEYDDFRDRAAFVYVTGTFPTHLRTFFTALLRKATKYTADPAALDRRGGKISTRPEVVAELKLEEHPMVVEVKRYLKEGWSIQPQRSVTERRPYSKIFLFKQTPSGRGMRRMTVQVDGSIKDGWE